MNKERITVKANALRAGDILAGSGFVVALMAPKTLGQASGTVRVRGSYPGSSTRDHLWNRNTTVTVLR